MRCKQVEMKGWKMTFSSPLYNIYIIYISNNIKSTIILHLHIMFIYKILRMLIFRAKSESFLTLQGHFVEKY